MKKNNDIQIINKLDNQLPSFNNVQELSNQDINQLGQALTIFFKKIH